MKVEWVPLGEVLVRAGNVAAVDPTADYPTLGVKSHARGAFDSGVLHGSRTAYATLTQVREGWLVYPKLMAWEGALAIVPPALDGRWVTPEFVAYELASEALSVDFLRHLIAWPGFLERVRAGSSGTNVRRRRLQPTAFEAITIPLPPRGEQHSIASHLTKLSAISRTPTADSGVMVERLVSTAADRAECAPLGELLRSHRPWMDIEGASSYRAIGVRGFGRGMIRYPEGGAETLSKLRYYPIEPGALIVSNIKAWEGAVCVAAESDAGRIASNRFLQYVPIGQTVTTGWVEQYLLSAAGLATLNAASPGSADRNRTLSMAAFEAIEIPVPGRETQAKVTRTADSLRRVHAQQARRDALAKALVPATRNEIFETMF